MTNEIEVTHKKRVTAHALRQLSDKSRTIQVIPLKIVSNCSTLISRLDSLYFVQEIEPLWFVCQSVSPPYP